MHRGPREGAEHARSEDVSGRSVFFDCVGAHREREKKSTSKEKIRSKKYTRTLSLSLFPLLSQVAAALPLYGAKNAAAGRAGF